MGFCWALWEKWSFYKPRLKLEGNGGCSGNPCLDFTTKSFLNFDRLSQALASFSWTFCLGPEESLGTQAKLKYPRWLKAQIKSGFVPALVFKTFLFLHYDFWPKDLMMRNSFSVFECWVECIFSVLHLIAMSNSLFGSNFLIEATIPLFRKFLNLASAQFSTPLSF